MKYFRFFFFSRLTAVAFLLSLTFSAATLFASGDIRFRNIQPHDGLSTGEVNCILKDSHGFMWFGTASGLNRYDGYSIKIFHSQRPDTTALRDNYVQSIQEDSDGNLWICAGDTYTLYDPATEQFHWFDDNEARKIGLPYAPQNVLIGKQRKWFTTESGAIYMHMAGKKCVKSYQGDPRHTITGMTEILDSENLFAVNSNGILIELDTSGKVVTSKAVFPTSPEDSKISLFPDQEGNIWVFSEIGTACFSSRTRTIEQRKICEILNGIPVKSIAQDDLGRLWFGTDNDGIYIVDKDNSIAHLVNIPADIYSLPNNTVKTIYNSGDGGMWLGTYKKGVSVYYPSEYKFPIRQIADVNCITHNPLERTTVWIGTDHSGLIKYNYTTNEATTVEISEKARMNAITCLATDSKGNLWIGTYLGGLRKYNGTSCEHWSTGSGLVSNNVWSILEGDNRKMWIGTLDRGLQVYDPDTHSFQTFDTSNSPIQSNNINSLTKGRNGTVFAGTTCGVVRISQPDYSMTVYRGSRKDNREFANLNINQVAADSRGLLWIGTREGLQVYDPECDIIHDISLSKKFPNPFILGIIEGADSTMWVTVGNEIYNISVTSRHDNSGDYFFNVKPYGSHDGMISDSFNQRSMCLLPSGEILAGTIEGILRINKDNISLNTNKPNVIFTGLSIKNLPIETNMEYDGKIILPEALDYGRKIILGYNQNDITIYFSTDNYSNAEHTAYRYRLRGFDDTWINCAAGAHHATYTNLPPGSYTIEVSAVNSDSMESEIPGCLNIEIMAPWWGTWWAKLLYIAIALAATICIAAWFHFRSLSLLKQRQKEELSKKTEELNQLKFKFFTNISHELRTPLTLILSPVESMLKEHLQEKDIRRLNTVKANAHRLLYLVNQLLDFRKNEIAGLTLHLSEGDIVASAKDACYSFTELTERKDISLEFKTSFQQLNMAYDNDKFTKILVNLLSNAVKYTPQGGSIKVSLVPESTDCIKVSVADTGKGISDEDKRHIFERFYRGSDKSDLNTGSGIGLSLVYEYAKIHGGSVEVTDNTPGGSVFSVIVPIRKSVAEPDSAIDQNSSPALAQTTGQDTATVSKTITTATHNGMPRVLFVDDNQDLIGFLKDEFCDTYDVSVASNGIEALNILEQSKPFDLIITDLMMPEMDGIELTRRLKSEKDTVNIPIIMLTAKQDMGSIVEGLTLGADDYITKPFNNEILALKMKRLTTLKEKGMKRTLIDPTPSRIEITSLDEQLIEKAVSYVEQNISRSDLSVEELARSLGMSRVHLYKKITMLTGKSPIEFIRLLRLKRATQYLCESQLTIAEIAYQLGFNNPKYFSKYFKEEFGMLPSEYQGKSPVNKQAPIY